jgi:hypothetical protein
MGMQPKQKMHPIRRLDDGTYQRMVNGKWETLHVKHVARDPGRWRDVDSKADSINEWTWR